MRQERLVIKVAILIDGGYFLKRLPVVRPDVDATDPAEAAKSVRQLVRGHLTQLNEVYGVPNAYQLLYRTFYYDARPYDRKAHTPVSNLPIDYATTAQALFRKRPFDVLRGSRNLAVRLGEVRKDSARSWTLRAEPQKDLLNGRRAVEDLADDDFVPCALAEPIGRRRITPAANGMAQGAMKGKTAGTFLECNECPGSHEPVRNGGKRHIDTVANGIGTVQEIAADILAVHP